MTTIHLVPAIACRTEGRSLPVNVLVTGLTAFPVIMRNAFYIQFIGRMHGGE